MKRICSLLLAVMLAGVFSFGEVGHVNAAKTSGKVDGVKLESTLPSSGSDNEYMKNAALVMFKVTKSKVTKSQTRKTLAAGKNSVSDITVKNLWTFSPKPELTKDSSGKRKLVRKQKGKEYVRVALVKSASKSTSELIRTFRKRSDVKYAEPNYKVTAQSVTNDEYSDFQWSMQGSEASPSDTAPNIWYQWKKSTGSDNIVAVVDTGVDYTHPDLKDRMWENTHYPKLKGECGYDFVNGDDDPMDDNNHGTHCSGIIGAQADNGIGVSGVNKDIRIMALKTLDYEGMSYVSNEIAAYNYIDQALDLGEPVKAINNSWSGGDENYIFGELIDIVGEKGAISVVVAGNEGADCDVFSEYPASIDSPYLIKVAATREDGKLAGFSSYGKRTIDTAAPGTDILSTVAYGSYNPTIYGDRQADYSDEFNDYESDEGWSDVSVDSIKENLYLNGKKYVPGSEGAPEITVSRTDEGFDTKGEGQAHSLYIEAKDLQAKDLICIPVPYEITQNTENAPCFSTMVKCEGSTGMEGILGMLEAEEGSDLSLNTIGDQFLLSGMYILENDFDNWTHMSSRMLEDEEVEWVKDNDSLKRQVVLLIFSQSGGDIRLCMDDAGLSKENVADMDDFGKYDFMSGTSMAAPYVTGTVALKAAELGTAAEESETLINEVVSMSRPDDDIPVIQKGSLDFRMRPEKLPPRVGRIVVDQGNDTLSIHGSGLGVAGTKVEIGDDEESLENVDIKSSSDRVLKVKNKKWINNIKTVKVTGPGERSSVREDVYLVRGKKTIKDVADSPGVPKGDMTTDGKNIYWTDVENSGFMMLDPSAEGAAAEPYATIEPDDIFKIKKKKNADYSMLFDTGAVYADGSLYAVAEYGMSSESESGDEDEEGFIIFEDEDSTGTTSIYSGEIRLLKTVSGEEGNEVVNLGKLPSGLEQCVDYAMAAYNGKLFFIGGYSYAKGAKGLSKKVWIYDPKTKKWSQGPALPEGRAGGKAIQSGGRLVYTMGYSAANTGKEIYDQKHPANLIFDGSKWKKSAVAEQNGIEPLVVTNVMTRGGKTYISSESDISLMKDGVFYSGNPVANYGDLFTYKTSGDKFADTGYNFVMYIDEDEMRGIVVGNKLYGFTEDAMYTMPVSGGLVRVTAGAVKNGSIKGTGSFMPGNTANVKVKAKTNYRIKSLKLNGKAVSLKKNQTSCDLTLKALVKDQKVAADFEKYKFKITVKKKGKGKVACAKTYEKGKTAKIKVKAKKGWYIKSINAGSKKIKVKKKAKKKTFKIKKIKKDITVKVVFKKAKKRKKKKK